MWTTTESPIEEPIAALRDAKGQAPVRRGVFWRLRRGVRAAARFVFDLLADLF